jgi:KamA family protein
LRRLRLHTRLPVVLPERVDASFLKMLAAWTDRKPVYLVLHANHARELDSRVAEAIQSLRKTGAILLNQAVLLRGVNDSMDALAELCLRLTDLGVLHYYLHQLDRVRGSRHFEVPEEEGLSLMAGLKSRVPGYAVPRYVREIPGQPSKTGVTAEYLETRALPL